jgi:hypothetical protein
MGNRSFHRWTTLSSALPDIFTRHAAAFDPHRMARMADAELEQATEPLRRELRALFAEYGEDVVTQAAPPILH